jgi:hypothetical protein
MQRALLGRRFDMDFRTHQLINKTSTTETNNALMHPKACALVTRPLPEPPAWAGVRTITINEGGYAIRAVMGYDTRRGGVSVTLETLYGVRKIYDELGVWVKALGEA